MSERQGHWIKASSIDMLEKIVKKLDEYLFDVVLEYDSLQTRCPYCHRRYGVRGFVHYIV